jgi:hypothetical protein
LGTFAANFYPNVSIEMSERAKRIFLAICIIVPFFAYCFYYYSVMIQNAPYRFTDFENIVLKYGEGNDLANQYDTQTGVFHYLNTRDSLISDTIPLRKDDLLYLHRKAVELGFWNLPDRMTDRKENEVDPTVPRFYLEYNYKEKSKKVLYDVDYTGPDKMKDAARSLIDEVKRVISDAKDR